MSIDAAESRDPRDPRVALGFMGKEGAIPKENVGRIVKERYVTFSKFEEVVGFTNVGQMVKGKRRMSNDKVIRVARALNVSPLVVLDLADEGRDAPPIHQLMDKRKELYEILTGTVLSEDVGDAGEIAEHSKWTGAASADPQARYARGPVTADVDLSSPVYAHIEVAYEAIHARGDFRDLPQLAADVLRMFPDAAAAILSSPIVGGGQ